MSFFTELKRRNVFKVAAAYLIVSWLLLQVSGTLVPALHLPEWFNSGVAFILILGFPIALLFAWAYEMTPSGLRKEQAIDGEIDKSQALSAKTGSRLNSLLFAAMAIALTYFAYDKFVLDQPGDSEPEQVTTASVLTQPVEPVEASPRVVLPNSVAVLPLENLSLKPEDAFFAAGIHDELLNQLAKIRDLNVIARTSVLRYANKGDKSILEIAQELKVEAVMEGTVRYGGNRVRITAQLIDGDNETHMWSKTYESEFDVENIFAIESDIAIQIAAALKAEILPTERTSIEKLPTTSTEALVLYLKAKASVTDIGPFMPPDEVANFHGYLDQALLADPGFALAHAWKAYEYGFSLSRTYLLTNDGVSARREALVRKHAQIALKLDPELGIAHGALAWPHTFGLRRAESLAAWERAYKLSPGDPDIVTDYGYIAAATGQTAQAISLARQALDMAPNSAQTVAVAGFAFIFAGDYDEAARIERKAIILDPAFFFSYLQLGLVEATRGNDAEALKHLQVAEELSHDVPSADIMSHITYGYGRIGRREDARRMFKNIENLATEFHVGAASWALAYLGIGDEERALVSLLAASDPSSGGEGFLALTYLAGNAFSDPALEQPEFLEARRKLGLREDL